MSDTFGIRLKAARLAAKMSQRELATAVSSYHLRCSFTYLSKIENDKIAPPSYDLVMLLAHILNQYEAQDEWLALCGHVPYSVVQLLIRSEGARQFFRAVEHADYLTLADWQRLQARAVSLDRQNRPLAKCGGCGRYGPLGKPCFRPCHEESGQMEECGEFC